MTTRNILFQHSDVFLSCVNAHSRYDRRWRREWLYVRDFLFRLMNMSLLLD